MSIVLWLTFAGRRATLFRNVVGVRFLRGNEERRIRRKTHAYEPPGQPVEPAGPPQPQPDPKTPPSPNPGPRGPTPMRVFAD